MPTQLTIAFAGTPEEMTSFAQSLESAGYTVEDDSWDSEQTTETRCVVLYGCFREYGFYEDGLATISADVKFSNLADAIKNI